MSMILWQRLDSATIEAAIKVLLVELYPGARPIDGRGGDRGRDVRWDAPEGLVIFEIKSFAGERLTRPQRREIEKSLARAAGHRPSRWVLVLPLDHSPSEEDWFDRLIAANPDITLEWRGVSWLNVEFGKREYLRRLVEAESYELLRLAQQFGVENAVPASVDEAVMQLARLTQQAQDLSPHWLMGFTATPDGITVMFRERQPGAAALDPLHLRTGFNFPDGDTAAAETRQRLAAVLDYGGDIEIDGRYLANRQALTGPASAALKGFSGQTESVRITSAPLQVADPLDYQLVVVDPSGAVKTRLALVMEPPTAGERGSRLTGRDGSATFDVVMMLDRPEFGCAVNGRLTVRGVAGRYPYQARPGLEFFRTVDADDRLQVRINDRCVGSDDGIAFPLAETRFCAEFVVALEQLQHHTGQLFPIPDDVTYADASDLIFAARLLSGDEIRWRGTEIKLTIRADRLESYLALYPTPHVGRMLIEQDAYAVRCGRHDLELGRVRVRAPHMQLTNLDQLHAAVGTGVDPVARYECIPDDAIYLQLNPPTNIDHDTSTALLGNPSDDAPLDAPG